MLTSCKAANPFMPNTQGNGDWSSSISSINSTIMENSDWVIIAIGAGSGQTSDSVGNYGLWVNGTALSFLPALYSSPISNTGTSPFPFTRLAATSFIGSTAFYLYHQINTSTFAEDVWDTTVSSWSSSYISIQTA